MNHCSSPSYSTWQRRADIQFLRNKTASSEGGIKKGIPLLNFGTSSSSMQKWVKQNEGFASAALKHHFHTAFLLRDAYMEDEQWTTKINNHTYNNFQLL